jgi:hypothetical protein
MKKIALLFIAFGLAWIMPALAGPRAEDAAPTAATAPSAAPAPAPATAPPREAQINFANHGGIWNWEVVDSTTVLIEDRGRRWYKATLLVNCIDLPFEQKIGFESNADGSFDKFSAIQTRQLRCPLSSLVRTEAPAKKQKKAAAAAAPTSPAAAPAAAGSVKSLN